MHIFLYLGIFMLVSGAIFGMVGKMQFVKKINASNEREQDLEMPQKLIKTGVFGMMVGILEIVIYLFARFVG